MPGWLPTAVVVNILPPQAQQSTGQADEDEKDILAIRPGGDKMATILLPENIDVASWIPTVPPIQIIDGQHRLLSFDDDELGDADFEIPVVAFDNLDVTWQAYLFYTINIKPVRINRSLAFDLYPILRIQDWLEEAPDGPAIYRETRAQELTEALWAHPDSPWYRRINMLGESKGGAVTQAAFIRSLMASYIKRWEGSRIGGLFGAELHQGATDVLRWDRPQQAAFLVAIWRYIADAVGDCMEDWARDLRPVQEQLPLGDKTNDLDAAFTSKYSLLATDQGVRGILQVTNDLCYVAADTLHLAEWEWEGDQTEAGISNASITAALRSLKQQQRAESFLRVVAVDLCAFDWRTSSAPNLNRNEQGRQMVFRGSGGYKELRRQLMDLLARSVDAHVRETAGTVIRRLGY